jgi:BirA family biotin operon repressor/biotin-[acetyl-CoA-carboxylase] ligase
VIDGDRLVRLSVARGIPAPVWTSTTTSTQDAVRTWAQAQRPAGLALFADEQTEGRGRLGRSWVADPGDAVLLSVLLRPDMPPARVPLIALAVAVAVRTATRGRLGIKWPNDLLAADGRKVAGILCEAEVSAGRVRWVVAGIGLNVRSAPKDLLDVGWLDDLGPPIPREDLVVDLIAMTLAWTRRAETEPERVLRAWRHGSATLGRRVRIGEVEGTADDVAEDGALLVRRDDGAITRIVAGDVEMVPGLEDEA